MAKKDSLFNFVRDLGRTSMTPEEFERRFKNSDYGDVSGFGRSIRRNSDRSSANYTRKLLRDDPDLQRVMRYDKRDKMYHFNENDSDDSYDSWVPRSAPVSLPSIHFDFPTIIVLALVVAIMAGASALINAGKVFFGNAVNYLSAEYEMEVFSYEGDQYAGNRRFDKPEGLCMRLDGGSDYTMGLFADDALDGYGIVVKDDGNYLEIGSFRKSKLNGYGICRNNGFNYVGKFKNGTLKGYGYCYGNGVEQFVKFDSVKAGSLDFRTHVSVIAQKEGDAWYKPNGKELKLKNGAYKGIEYLREGLIRIDDVEYYFDTSGEAFYDSPEVELSWEADCCSFCNLLDNEEGFYLNYTYGEGLDGHQIYKKGKERLCRTFAVGITNG